jgi:predicted Zn-dependent protease
MRRTWTTVFALLWAVALAFALVRDERVALAEDADETPEIARPLVVVRALGPVPEERLRGACRSLLRAYPVRCEIGGARELLASWSAWNVDRAQLDARAAIDLLFTDRSPEALVELNITGVDMYEVDKPYVFGLASLTDRVALVSLSRIDDDGGEKLRRRFHKLVLHEAGHALGLHHHDDRDCVMRQDPTVASLDSAPDRPCAACHAELTENAVRLTRQGQAELDRVRGHLVRGRFDDARVVLADVLHSGAFDHDLLRAFAAAFFEARQYNEAISVLRFVVKQDPQAAEAHVDLGLCYQVRAREGDHDAAIEHLEIALELRPDWELVAQHLDALIADA